MTCLLRNKFSHHISGMDIYGTNCHDLLSVTRWKFSQQKHNQCIQLRNLGGIFYKEGRITNAGTNIRIVFTFVKSAVVHKIISNLLSQLVFKESQGETNIIPTCTGQI